VTYKKTKRVQTKNDDDDDSKARTILRVVLRQILEDSDRLRSVVGSGEDATVVNRRTSLRMSGCGAPFCARRRRLRLHRGNDYIIMGHVDPTNGHLLLDQRSVIANWKPGWPAKIQVADCLGRNSTRADSA